MGKLDGKTAFITGAARGQGRSHAIQLAREGANIIAVDICQQIDSVPYPMSTPDDLKLTVKEVEALGRTIFASQVDVRNENDLSEALREGIARCGQLDIVLANAGISPMVGQPIRAESRREVIANMDSQRESQIGDPWKDALDVNVTGVFNTIEVALPSMIAQGVGGAIVITSSTAGNNGIGGSTRAGLGYTASKHAVVGLMRSYANNLATYKIRVNTVHPTGVNTPMVVNDVFQTFIKSLDEVQLAAMSNALPVEMIEPIDISNAILWLVSDDARYVTGIELPVDAGFSNKK